MTNPTLPSRARARVRRPASISPEGFERMRDEALGHLLAVIGVAVSGQPRLGEPLCAAMKRVHAIVGGDSYEAACRLAGCAAVRAEADDPVAALDSLIRRLPSWLGIFALVHLDGALWGLASPPVEPGTLSPLSVRKALRAWPCLPAGACILKTTT